VVGEVPVAVGEAAGLLDEHVVWRSGPTGRRRHHQRSTRGVSGTPHRWPANGRSRPARCRSPPAPDARAPDQYRRTRSCRCPVSGLLVFRGTGAVPRPAHRPSPCAMFAASSSADAKNRARSGPRSKATSTPRTHVDARALAVVLDPYVRPQRTPRDRRQDMDRRRIQRGRVEVLGTPRRTGGVHRPSPFGSTSSAELSTAVESLRA
jgi:hypothetical protein